MKAADKISAGGAVNDSFSIYGMPIPIIDPTIGHGLAVGVLGTFRLDPDDKVSPRSTVAAGAGYTDTQSYAFGTSTSLYLDEDRVPGRRSRRLWQRQHQVLRHRERFPVQEPSAGFQHPADCSRAPMRGSGWSITSTSGRSPNTWTRPRTSTCCRASCGRIDLDYKLAGAGLISEYDLRDTSFSPHEGIYTEVEFTRFDERIGSDFNFFSLDGSAAEYLELTPDLVMAGQARIAAASGNPPFFALPYITLRGFPAGKYLNERSPGRRRRSCAGA